jgi:Domain of unknown function (DUF4328)
VAPARSRLAARPRRHEPPRVRRVLGGSGGAVCLGVAVTALVSAGTTTAELLLVADPDGPADLVAAGRVVRMITFGATALLLVLWTYRARVNLVTMPWSRPRWAPGWVVGAVVVPGLGPFMFAAILADVARESAPRAEPAAGNRLAGVAWAWLATALPAAVLFGAAVPAPEPAAYVLLAGAEGCQLTAAVLLLVLVRTVTAWHDDQPPPRGWRPPTVPVPRQPLPGDATMRT